MTMFPGSPNGRAPVISLAHKETVGDDYIGNFFSELGQGLQNAFYDLTGQEEKTSFYQEQVERENELIARQEAREDTAYQRQVADMNAAGLSMYGASGGGAASSAGGSSSVHSGSDSVSKIAAMIDMRKSLAEIGNVQANTNKTNAEAAATTAGVERDDLYYALAEQKQGAELVKMDFDNKLTQQMTAESAQKVIASVQTQAREQAKFVYDVLLNNADLQLKYKDIESYNERKEAELSVKRSSALLNYERSVSESKQREYIDQQMKESEERIRKYLKEELHLDAETLQLGVDYAMAVLKLEMNQHDLDYARRYGLPVGSQASGIFGSALTAGATLKNLFRSKFHGSTGDVFVPSFGFDGSNVYESVPKAFLDYSGGGYAW